MTRFKCSDFHSEICFYKFPFYFFLDFGLSRLTSLQFIQYQVAGFYKPTIPQSPPSNLRDYSTCNNASKFLLFCLVQTSSVSWPNQMCKLQSGSSSHHHQPRRRKYPASHWRRRHSRWKSGKGLKDKLGYQTKMFSILKHLDSYI
jgi:hypothetical protein